MQKIQNYIGGQFIDPVNLNYIDNFNPATGEIIGQIPNSDTEDIALAVIAAEKARKGWANTSLDNKYQILTKIAFLIRENEENLAQAESLDNGKPIWLSRKVDIPRAAQNFEFFATSIKHFESKFYYEPPNIYSQVLREPVGIVGCISPWNLPLYLFTWKIAPALASGNCVIAKPSEVTPYTAYLLADICANAGLPPGVLNIVHGTGMKTGAAIVSHPAIKAISFTGGTRTGAQIASIAAPMFKKLSLELGGKNPAVIFDDCNYSQMLKETVRSSFTNQGQICLCTSRILIQNSIYEKFKKDFIAETEKLTVGHPAKSESKQGAIVSAAHLEKIANSVQSALKDGGKLLTGGKKLNPEALQGYYYSPTILENLGPEHMANCEEIFGPVVTLQPFETIDEAIHLANASDYGLAATIWSQNTTTIHQMSAAIQAGIVWVNCWLVRDLRTPFGGIKNSGVGREGGWDVMNFFTETKSITQVF